MPYELFWHGDPSLYYNYLDAYEQKMEDKDKAFVHKENFKAWLQGLYVDYALSCNPPLGRKTQYLQKPLEFKDEEETKEANTSEELTSIEEQQAIAQFMAFGQLVEVMNNKRKENGN